MKKGFFKKTGALMLAATLTVSMVQVPVYGATTKTVTVSNQKQLNKALKVAKGKKAYSIIVKAGKNTKVTIPKENYKNVTELTGFRSPSEQEQIGRYMQRKYQRSIKFDKVMGISCVIVGFLSAVLSFGNIAAIAVAVAFLIAGFLD